MGSTTNRRGNVKREAGDEASEVVRDQLEELARAGAREMLMRALHEEVEAYLGRGRYGHIFAIVEGLLHFLYECLMLFNRPLFQIFQFFSFLRQCLSKQVNRIIPQEISQNICCPLDAFWDQCYPPFSLLVRAFANITKILKFTV